MIESIFNTLAMFGLVSLFTILIIIIQVFVLEIFVKQKEFVFTFINTITIMILTILCCYVMYLFFDIEQKQLKTYNSNIKIKEISINLK